MTSRFVLVGLLACSSLGVAQTPEPCATAPQSCATLIETHANSEMRIPNTVVDVVIGVSAAGKDLPEVERSLADQSNKLLVYLKAQQVERLITAFTNFTPDTRSQKSAPDKTVGYEGSAKVSFRAKPDKISELLAGVLTNGGSAIQSTRFAPTDDGVKAERLKLSADATKTAIAQADVIAGAAGMKVVAIRNINVDDTDTAQLLGKTQYQYLATLDSGVAADGFNGGQIPRNRMTDIQTAAGETQLSVSVSVIAAASR